MNTTIRSDIHRPSAVDPADYRELDGFYQGSSAAMAEAYESADPITPLRNLLGDPTASLKAHLERNGNHATKGTCDHCGAAFAHGVYFLHLPSEQVVSVGHTCASNTFGCHDRSTLLRKRAESLATARRKADNIKKDAEAWGADHPEVLAHLERFAATNNFYADLLRKLRIYGGLTDNQTAAVERNIDRDIDRVENQANRAAEWEATKRPIPTLIVGTRSTITGTIVSLKDTWNDYGAVTKMLVLDDRNFKLWGTCPRAIKADAKRGSRVTFAATVKASNDDESFGFFSRPSQARLLVTAGPDNEAKVPTAIGA